MSIKPSSISSDNVSIRSNNQNHVVYKLISENSKKVLEVAVSHPQRSFWAICGESSETDFFMLIRQKFTPLNLKFVSICIQKFNLINWAEMIFYQWIKKITNRNKNLIPKDIIFSFCFFCFSEQPEVLRVLLQLVHGWHDWPFFLRLWSGRFLEFRHSEVCSCTQFSQRFQGWALQAWSQTWLERTVLS